MKAAEIRAVYQKFGLDNPGEPPSAANHAAVTKNDPESVDRTVKQVNRRPTGEPESDSGRTRTDPARPDVAVLWKLRPDKSLEPVRIRSGITDHTVTEVAELFNGSLKNDDELVTGAVLTGPKMGPGTTVANRH